ncbi:MAG: deoxynucleoside kinase [Candidatus Doudnabacteria bacterium]|nr:deoxynucleoside kinase [Candidatus Doudnabacteria bacterium]
MPKGKFIVIDGTDGSGKATQTKLLIKKLTKAGIKVTQEDFPQYSKKSAGPIEEYLNGLYGTSDELGAYIPSVFFAVDRFAASARIRDYLKKGYVVVSNRYVTANMAHQGGKIKNNREREKYFKWITDFEYNIFKIPKPDLHIVLHIPPETSVKLIKQRGRQYYIGKKKKDIHESDIEHLRSAEKIYLEIAKKFKFKVVEGVVDGRLLTPEEVSNKIYPIVHGYLRN